MIYEEKRVAGGKNQRGQGSINGRWRGEKMDAMTMRAMTEGRTFSILYRRYTDGDEVCGNRLAKGMRVGAGMGCTWVKSIVTE